MASSTQLAPPPLVRLADPDPDVRLAAVDAVDPRDPTARFALRQILLGDEDAETRARAAHRLGESRVRRAIPALLEALDDPMPSVRERSYRALARLEAIDVLPHAARAARREAVWWVRRAAIHAAAVAAGKDALALLLLALDDPFWRVRHAAIQALSVLGEEDPDVRAAVASHAASHPQGPVASAAAYLASAWTGAPTPAAPPTDAVLLPLLHGELGSEDPAVVTARLETEDDAAVPAPALVAWLGDPHAPLRALARRRLRERRDQGALLLALRWLDEPRVPHAAAEVRALLDRLEDDPTALARRILGLDPPPPGALAWAAEVLAVRGSPSDLDRLRALANHPDPALRRATLAGLLLDERTLPLALEALDDPDEDVRAVVLAAWERRPSAERIAFRWSEALVAFTPRSARERRAATEAAALLGDLARLARASSDDDPRTRALALEARSALGDLPDDERARALADEDPWIRAAALDPRSAPVVAVSDPDPWVRQAALALVGASYRRDLLSVADIRPAALACALAPDPFLRSLAAGLLDPALPDDLRALLRLSQDRTPMVRAAAASTLESSAPALEDRLLALLELEHDPAVRTSAFTWLLRDADERALARLVRALAPGVELDSVRSHLQALTLTLPPSALAKEPSLAEHRPRPVPATAPRPPRPATRPSGDVDLRPLGETGLRVSPLVVSGVHGLVAASFADARDAGVNAFFWEPRYLELTRFLRSRRAARDGLVVVTGSYHAGPDALRADVERALRRLRTDWIDVFLLFWVRAPDRLSEADFEALARMREEGKLRAFGFSTHDRALAVDALGKHPWPVVMTRHSAAHPGAEEALFPEARARNAGVLTFTATSYGRLLRPAPGEDDDMRPSAPDCYRYCLTQPGVSACLTAPRSHRELVQNLSVLGRPTLPSEALAPIRAHGARVRAETRRVDALVRRAPGGPRDRLRALLEEGAGEIPLPPEPKI